jgi:dTMP kinase
LTRQALHVAFVGIDGAGKSRQAGLLNKRLTSAGHDSYLFEAKDDFNVEMLQRVAYQQGRPILDLWGVDTALTAQTLGSLSDYYRITAPLLNAGCHVVESRSLDARPAFARSAGARSPELLDALIALCPRPALSFYLRVPPEEALRRLETRGIDSEEPGALRAYAEQLEREQAGADWLVLDGTRPADELSRNIWKQVSDRLAADPDGDGPTTSPERKAGTGVRP